jgi:antirestriction protein ArdC
MTNAYDKVIDELSEKLIAELSAHQSDGKYRRSHKIFLPYNVDSEKAYSGTNVIVLVFQMRATPVWGTFNQWNKLGYHPVKHSGVAVYSPPLTKRDIDANGNEILSERPPRAYHVFNAEDVRNEAGEAYAVEEIGNAGAPVPDIERWIERVGAEIIEWPDNPAYSRRKDIIKMPPFHSFVSPELYYSALSHELIHWTGAASRLNRDTLIRSGDDIQIRAKEELCAEIGATMLCAKLNVSYDAVRDDHLSYIANWLTALEQDKSYIREAVKNAAAAVRYLDEIIATE